MQLIKAKNLIGRLLNISRLPASIQPQPPEQSRPILKPPKPLSTSKKEIEDHEYSMLQYKLTKRLIAKGMTDKDVVKQFTTSKPKAGIMDNIGEIIDCDFNTIPLNKAKKVFNR